MSYTYKVTEYNKRICLNVVTDTWDNDGIKTQYYAYIPLSDIQRELSQKILGIAQNALETGGTWSDADRMGVLVEALEDIIKEVNG